MKTALSIKGITFGLTLIFWATSIPTYAATAVQPGSVCSKQGMTKIYQGKKYSCKKSGNKLVWDKGVAVSKPKSTSAREILLMYLVEFLNAAGLLEVNFSGSRLIPSKKPLLMQLAQSLLTHASYKTVQ